jgi:polyisoprenoid-binding protein YceI
MSKKIMLVFIALGLTLAVACKSELDNKGAATVGEAQPTEAPEAAEAPAEEAAVGAAVSTRQVAFNVEASKIEWLGANVTGDHKGGFNTWTGTATVDGDNKLTAVNFEVQMDSLYSDNDRLTGHLKSDDFFDVPNHPTSTFASTTIADGGADGATHTVTGNLTLRGVTKSLTFPATVNVEGDKLVAKADFKFNRMDFNVAFTGKPDNLIRDEVALTLHFEAPLAEQAPAAAVAE